MGDAERTGNDEDQRRTPWSTQSRVRYSQRAVRNRQNEGDHPSGPQQ